MSEEDEEDEKDEKSPGIQVAFFRLFVVFRSSVGVCILDAFLPVCPHVAVSLTVALSVFVSFVCLHVFVCTYFCLCLFRL